jgi:hypothetical protein
MEAHRLDRALLVSDATTRHHRVDPGSRGHSLHHTESTFRLDGHSYPVLGGTLGDALSARPSGPRSLEVTVTRGGALSAQVQVTVSADGKVMTMHSEVILPPNANITWTTVSERQEAG